MSDDPERARLSAADHAYIEELVERLGRLPAEGQTLRLVLGLFGLLSAAFALRARNWWLLALSLGATLAMLWFTRAARAIGRVQRDAADGHKRVRRAEVSDRYCDEQLFVLVLDGVPTAVDKRWFDACGRGDAVYLDTLPRSGVLVGIRRIER